MDVAGPLRSEVFRPLMTLLVPGATAVAPYALLLHAHEAGVADFFDDHTLTTFALLVVAALAAGFVIEDLGAALEDLLDGRRDKQDPTHRAVWHQYLMLSLPSNPIGQRYVRRVLLRLHFELHFAIALAISWGGWYWLQKLDHMWTRTGFLVFSGLLCLVTLYLLIEAPRSMKVLARVRANLVKHYFPREFPTEP